MLHAFPGCFLCSPCDNPDASFQWALHIFYNTGCIQRCKQRYILSDPSKFNRISPVTFAPFSCATVITTRLQDERYRKYTNIREVDAE